MPSDSSLLIRGGTVALFDESLSVLNGASVAVVDGRIDAVGDDADMAGRYPDAPVIDAGGKLVMPGLVNAHTHLYSALARGIVADIEPSSNFTEILRNLWWKLDRALTEDDVRLSAAAGSIDLIRNGTTTIIDHHASQVNVAGSLSALAEPLIDIGVRANVCFEVSDRDGEAAREDGLRENARFAELVARERGGDVRGSGTGETAGPRLAASVGLHASFTLEDETLRRAGEMAASLGTGCHVHVAEDLADVEDSLSRSGKRVVERLESFGVLGPTTVAAHCIHVDDREISILRDTGTIVVHNPQSNMNNAVGCTNVPGMLDRGLLVGLGTDGFTASMFDEARVANLIHRHEAHDPRVGHDIATRLCLGGNPEIASRLFNDRVGRIETGALADIIILDYDPPTPLETGNFGGHLIFGLTGWMVETVIVGGRTVMRDREIVTIDEHEVLGRARDRARELWERM